MEHFSSHDILVLATAKKLEKDGYVVLKEGFLDLKSNKGKEAFGVFVNKDYEGLISGGNPDLIAVKGEEIVVVEVHMGRLSKQIERYSRFGKIILVFPTKNTPEIEAWGLDKLVAPGGITTKKVKAGPGES